MRLQTEKEVNPIMQGAREGDRACGIWKFILAKEREKEEKAGRC